MHRYQPPTDLHIKLPDSAVAAAVDHLSQFCTDHGVTMEIVGFRLSDGGVDGVTPLTYNPDHVTWVTDERTGEGIASVLPENLVEYAAGLGVSRVVATKAILPVIRKFPEHVIKNSEGFSLRDRSAIPLEELKKISEKEDFDLSAIEGYGQKSIRLFRDFIGEVLLSPAAERQGQEA